MQEPSLSTQLSSLYASLLGIHDTADIARFGVAPISAQRSRSFEGGIDQNIYSDRAILRFTYFHNVYSNGIEYVPTTLYNQYFNQSLPKALYGFYLNSLSTNGQGIEAQLEYQIARRLFLRTGYSYLDAVVLRSFSSDALRALSGQPAINAKYPGTPIGISSPLVGQRPFRRAPQTGYVVLQYAGNKWSSAVKSAMSSRSDDSTFIDSFSNANFDTSLLLPNRNLAFGFTKLDANVTYSLRPSITVFSQMENLLNQQHIGAFGYPSLPLTVRAGVKIRFPRE